MTKRTTDDALAELREVSERLAELAKLQPRRRELLLECRAADPPVPIATLAEVCGTSTVAINVALSKARAALADAVDAALDGAAEPKKRGRKR